jgi:Na+-translocating ferredoxin:NAD+ oxidoreductase RnfE subunit
MAAWSDNPFAALTLVVAPAILTNASSVLCLGTGNRIARVVDRTRVVTAELAKIVGGGVQRDLFVQQLDGLRVRSQLLLRALRFFYASLGSFAAAALITVIGSVLATAASHAIFDALAILGLMSGSLGVAGIVTGCTLMVQETRLAVRNLAAEARLTGHPPAGF